MTSFDKPKVPMHAHELPFNVPAPLSETIDELADAIVQDDLFIDAYYENMLGLSRMVDNDIRDWLINYYVNHGWEEMTSDDFDIDSVAEHGMEFAHEYHCAFEQLS